VRRNWDEAGVYLEQMLVIALESGARPVVLLNKIDSCDDLDARLADATRLTGDALVLAACALTGRGVRSKRPPWLPALL